MGFIGPFHDLWTIMWFAHINQSFNYTKTCTMLSWTNHIWEIGQQVIYWVFHIFLLMQIQTLTFQNYSLELIMLLPQVVFSMSRVHSW